MKDIKHLQNGSDIRGIAITTTNEKANLTPVEAKKISVGLVNWLIEMKQLKAKRDQGDLKIAIGKDSRLSGDELKGSLAKELLAQGVNVIDMGLATTPAMFMATQFSDFACDAGIMITASHLPYQYNGIKIFTASGGAEKEDIAYILDHTETYFIPRQAGMGTKADIISLYAEDLTQKICQGISSKEKKPLTGFHIIVDAGNGAGGFFAEKVLTNLGADTKGSQFLEPDGTFPNHIPNPDNKEAMDSIRQAVLASGADLGVIFDTDVDRAAVVDHTGEVLNRNNLIAVLAAIVLKEHPQTTIVTNSPTSSHLKTFINELGGSQVRYLCGYRNVINKAITLNDQGINTELAIETSGHAAFKENYFLDDGAYVIAKILMLLPILKKEGKDLSDLIGSLKQPAEATEVRFKIQKEDYQAYGQNVIHELKDFVAKTAGWALDLDNEEGVRVNVTQSYGSGWFLLRMSLHEPLLVLQVENDAAGKNHLVFQQLAFFFKNYSDLEQTALLKVLNNN